VNGRDEVRLLAIKEFAKKIGYGERHVRRLIKKGKLNAIRLEGGRKWLISESELDKPLPANTTLRIEEAKHDSIEMKRKHFNQLVQVAEALLSNGLDSLRPIADDEYLWVESDAGQVTINKQELVEDLKNNLKDAGRRFRSMDMFCYFKAHLEAENPKARDLEKFAEDSPIELIGILKSLCLRGTFKSKCPVCKDW